jgi:hypothetical protein
LDFRQGAGFIFKRVRCNSTKRKNQNTFISERLFFDTASGIDWDNLIGGKSQKEIILQVKATILQSFGVTDLLSFDTIYNAEDRSFELQYEINTIYGQNRSDNVEVLAYA